jgi:hypothetical protein
MPDLFQITLDDEIAEIEREVNLRQKVYIRWIAQGRLTDAKADWQLAVMRRVLMRLQAVRASASADVSGT